MKRDDLEPFKQPLAKHPHSRAVAPIAPGLAYTKSRTIELSIRKHYASTETNEPYCTRPRCCTSSLEGGVPDCRGPTSPVVLQLCSTLFEALLINNLWRMTV